MNNSDGYNEYSSFSNRTSSSFAKKPKRGSKGGNDNKLPRDDNAVAIRARIAILKNRLKGLNGARYQAYFAWERANQAYSDKTAEVASHGCNAAWGEIRDF